MPPPNPLAHLDCGRVRLSGVADGLYERHLTSIGLPRSPPPRPAPSSKPSRARSATCCRSAGSRPSRRTRPGMQTGLLPVARVLMGRSLANNITNLLLDPVWSQLCKKHQIDPLEIIEQEPTPVSVTAGSAGWPRASWIRWRRSAFRAWAPACATSTASSSRPLRDGWQHEQPDHWLARPDPWECRGRTRPSKCGSACSFDIHAGALRTVQAGRRRSSGFRTTRPVVGVRRTTINTLRLWSAATPDYFDFQQFSGGRLRRRAGRDAHGRNADAVLYPDDSTTEGKGCASCSSTSSWPARWPTRSGGSARPATTGRAARQGRDAAQRHAPDARRSRADADPPRRGEARSGTRPGISRSARSPTRTTRCCPERWRSGRCRGSR
jgi:starch phosphorylase